MTQRGLKLPNFAADYGKRVEEFRRRLDTAKSETLKSPLHKALSATNNVGAAFAELSEFASNRWVPAIERRVQTAHSKMEGAVQNAAQLTSQLKELINDPTADPEIKQTQAMLNYTVLVSSQNLVNSEATTLQLMNASFLFLLVFLVNSVGLKVLRADYTKFNANAVREGLLFAVGLIPIIGETSSAVGAIKSIVSAPDKEFKAADEYSAYLEQYEWAANLWCLGTRKIISLYSRYIDARKGSVGR